MVHKISFAAGRLAIALTAVLVAASAGGQTSGQLDEVVTQRVGGNRAGTKSQVRIDKVSDETDKLTSEYRSVLQQIDALRIYNRQVEELIVAQQAEIASQREQIDNVELVGRQVTPLMLEMIAALEAFVGLDVPFLMNERTSRITALRETVARADVTSRTNTGARSRPTPVSWSSTADRGLWTSCAWVGSCSSIGPATAPKPGLGTRQRVRGNH